MHSTTWPAILVLLTIALLVWTSMLVGRARVRLGVAAPATTGNPEFERVFRVQMNTLEAAVLFLPTLWLAAQYGTAAVTAGAGLVWFAGRVYYALSYMKNAASRSPGFGIAALGWAVMLLDALVGLAHSLLA
jgi:hypothetical protein